MIINKCGIFIQKYYIHTWSKYQKNIQYVKFNKNEEIFLNWVYGKSSKYEEYYNNIDYYMDFIKKI